MLYFYFHQFMLSNVLSRCINAQYIITCLVRIGGIPSRVYSDLTHRLPEIPHSQENSATCILLCIFLDKVHCCNSYKVILGDPGR